MFSTPILASCCLEHVQFSCSVKSDSLRPHELQHARPPCPSPTPGVHSNSRPSSQMPSSHLILCRPLLLLTPIPPSIRLFSNESTLRMRWPKYWSFSFSIIPSKEHPGPISFRIDWLDLLAVQRTQEKVAAAKLLQSCPTLCDPIDGSPPGSPVPGILQDRTLEWVAISFSRA